MGKMSTIGAGMHFHRLPTRGLVLAALLATFSIVGPARGLCPGDCNGDGSVTINELLRGVNLALGAGAYRLCPPADVSGDGQVTIDEILGAVNMALAACPETVG